MRPLPDMTRRRTILFAVILAVVLAGGAIVRWGVQPSELERKLAQVHAGMTRADVEKALGPAAHWTMWKTAVPWAGHWDSAEGLAWVSFSDEAGVVVEKGFRRFTVFFRLRYWLGW